MKTISKPVRRIRYAAVNKEKAAGATYTPKELADFVAEKIVETFETLSVTRPTRILDPAIGDGELLVSLLEKIKDRRDIDIEVHGFELNRNALSYSTSRIAQLFPRVRVN